MGPGKYDPKIDLITKNITKTKFLPERVKHNSVALKLEKVLHKAAIEGRKQDDYYKILDMKSTNTIDLRPANELTDIKTTVQKNARQGVNACFASTTKRITFKSDVPGPGSYEIVPEHQFYTSNHEAFGTTSERVVPFNRSIHLPFTDPSYLSNPPVGHYNHTTKFKNIKSISPFRYKHNDR
jgi:hypothetical protein